MESIKSASNEIFNTLKIGKHRSFNNFVSTNDQEKPQVLIAPLTIIPQHESNSFVSAAHSRLDVAG